MISTVRLFGIEGLGTNLAFAVAERDLHRFLVTSVVRVTFPVCFAIGLSLLFGFLTPVSPPCALALGASAAICSWPLIAILRGSVSSTMPSCVDMLVPLGDLLEHASRCGRVEAIISVIERMPARTSRMSALTSSIGLSDSCLGVRPFDRHDFVLLDRPRSGAASMNQSQIGWQNSGMTMCHWTCSTNRRVSDHAHAVGGEVRLAVIAGHQLVGDAGAGGDIRCWSSRYCSMPADTAGLLKRMSCRWRHRRSFLARSVRPGSPRHRSGRCAGRQARRCRTAGRRFAGDDDADHAGLDLLPDQLRLVVLVESRAARSPGASQGAPIDCCWRWGSNRWATSVAGMNAESRESFGLGTERPGAAGTASSRAAADAVDTRCRQRRSCDRPDRSCRDRETRLEELDLQRHNLVACAEDRHRLLAHSLRQKTLPPSIISRQAMYCRRRSRRCRPTCTFATSRSTAGR